ncbi:class II aldolase/adducin family protein [Humitalea sp. 24SJ18S-53]|uniref:class II aldolase/adducin family protein n=1 Tax=Humitalea sp. 24SJ18S-53 TaxID=3422307 RepID=UPI003D67DB45
MDGLTQATAADEWQLRCDLAALYRLVAHHKMTDLIYTHISARVPGPEHHFLINRYGVLFHEMRASDLVKIDLDGRVVEDQPESKRINTAGFIIHSAIHMARPDLACVIHTHTPDGIAVSVQDHGLLPLTQQSMKFYKRIAYHDYEGISLDLSERERLVRDLGSHKAMILHSHGLLVGGATIHEAFHNIYYLERACQTQIKALGGGGKLKLPPAAVCEHAARQFDALSAEHYAFFWNSALRLVEAEAPAIRR